MERVSEERLLVGVMVLGAEQPRVDVVSGDRHERVEGAG